MTAHLCRTFDPGCYRCDLGRDEEIAALAEAYHEVMLEPGMRSYGFPEGVIDGFRLRYISDVRLHPEAIRDLYAWHARREAADVEPDRAWNVLDAFVSSA